MAYMLDTNVFNRLLDGALLEESLPSGAPFVATHVQLDELNATPETIRRTKLLEMFSAVAPDTVPTESAVWGVSQWAQAPWGTAGKYSKLLGELEAAKRRKSNAQDALIGEVCLLNSYTLVTADRAFAEVLRQNGGKVLFVGT